LNNAVILCAFQLRSGSFCQSTLYECLPYWAKSLSVQTCGKYHLSGCILVTCIHHAVLLWQQHTLFERSIHEWDIIIVIIKLFVWKRITKSIENNS